MERKALEELEKFGISRVKNLEHWDKLGFEVRRKSYCEVFQIQ